MTPARHAKKFLRSPGIVVGELASLALLCSVGAAVPQKATATVSEIARFQESAPLLARAVHWLALDHVFNSALFCAVAALTSASLCVVIFEQLKRLRLQWSQRLTEAHFRSAPFQAEFEVERASNSNRIWSKGRIGLFGSPVFHAGLLMILVAGGLWALFGSAAVVDLIEGETLPPTAAAWAGQFPGVWGKPFHLDTAVTLDNVQSAHYKDGDLAALKVKLSQPGAGAVELAVNRDFKVCGARLFLSSDFGPSALMEWERPGTPPKRQAAMLAETNNGFFEGASTGLTGEKAYLRGRIGPDGARPDYIEVRIMKDGALLYTGEVGAGQTAVLPDGSKLSLHGTPFWARLRGSRDSALWLAYSGFAFVLGGAALMFAVVKRDFCVFITPAGDRERIFVALRPQRFAPLFEEEFERLVERVRATSTRADSLIPTDVPLCTTDSLLQRVTTPLLLVLAAGMLGGCGRPAVNQARKMVEKYNSVVSEAYRRGDVRLVDTVAGPNEGKKLTGLIGVRLDAGITLDSKLLSLDVTNVEQAPDEMRVSTRERWSYRDRRIGTGEQVAEESLDSYEMLYVFKKIGKAWLVDEIRFASEPQVGRKKLPFPNERPVALHGSTAETKSVEVKQ